MEKIGLLLSATYHGEMIGRWVTYHGRRRAAELGNGQVFKVVDQTANNASVALDAGIYGIQWCAVWALRIADAPAEPKAESLTLEQAEEILNPHSNTLDSIDAEIKRLEEKLKDLRLARQVISGL